MTLRYALPLFGLLGTTSAVAQGAGDELFDTDQVIELRFTFPESNYWTQLSLNHNAESGVSLPADLVITDQSGTYEFDSVAVRLKGNSSFDFYPSSKKPMKLEFDDFVDGQEYHGLKRLNLNNCWSDPSFLREKLFLDACRREGVLAPRMGFANVYLNDIFWGFYGVVEQVDKTFLDRWLGDNDGNLFKAGDNYTPDGGGVGEEADLNYYGPTETSYTGRYELKTNTTENDWSDLIELLDVIDNSSTTEFVAQLPERMELTEALRSLALDNLFGNMDAYYGSSRNYYLYHDSTTLKWNWIHWDANMSFGRYVPQWIDDPAVLPATYVSSGRRMLQRVMGSSTLRRMYLEEFCGVFEHFTNDELDPRIDELRELVDAHVNADFNKEFAEGVFELNIEQTVTAQSGQTWNTIPGLKSFIAERRTSLSNSTLDCTTVGLAEVHADDIFLVAPNPTRDRVTMSLPNGAVPTAVSLFDATGRPVLANVSGTVVDLSLLPSGIYVLAVELADGPLRKSIVKE